MNSGKKGPQIIAGLSAAGGAFCSGTALGWSAPAASRLIDEEQYFPITISQWSWIASILTIGFAISCIPVGYLMNKYGRKTTMLWLVVPFLIGWGLIIWAQNFVMMLIGRLFLGLAGGAFFISAPQYSAEIAEKGIRGVIGSFLQLLLALGILFVYVIGAYVSVFWMSIICGICPIIFAVIFFFMPESPVYLVIKNKENQARKSLVWLRGKDYDPAEEIADLKGQLCEEITEIVPFSVAIKERSSIIALVIGIGLLYFQQMSMINAVLLYSTTIFAAAGVGLSADISTIIIGALLFVSSILGSFLIDRLGRRVLLLISISTMSLTLFVLGNFFYIKSIEEEFAESLGWLPLTSLCIYMLVFPFGFGAVPWLVVSEVAPKKMKAFCGPIIGFFSWGLTFVITLSFANVTELLGTGQTFWIFGAASVVGILFTFFVVPETKGKSLAEIEELLNKKAVTD